MGVVEFNWDEWSVLYGELANSVSEQLAKVWFKEAQLYCDNTPKSPIQNLTTRESLLGMMTAHLITLNVPLKGQPSSPLVGRISSATEGTVTVQVENKFPEGTPQWYQQTKYGARFWAATTQFRSFIYEPGQPFIADPYAPKF